MTYKVVHGIKLFERKCKMCTVTFWVAESHPQKYCSELCEQDDKGKRFRNERNKGKHFKAKRKLKYKLQRSDYETPSN